GCAAESGGSDDVQNERPYDADQALSLGARGAQVSEIQAYLTAYGYFPSDALAERFPNWHPITTVTPQPGVYDEPTQAAVRELQRRNGIEPTGVTGPETRRLIAQPRCGNPDSFEFDPDSKFALGALQWKAGKRSFSWKAA